MLRVREREQGERRRARESESGAGQLRGFARGIEGERRKQEVASRGGGGARACRRASGTRPSSWQRRKATGEGGQAGWAASWLGRPAAAGLRRGGEAQVSFSPLFCFLFNFLTFV